MSAHLDLWLAHLASALSHTQAPIKVDALRALQLLVRAYPELIAEPRRHKALAQALVPLTAQHAALARAAKDAPALIVATIEMILSVIGEREGLLEALKEIKAEESEDESESGEESDEEETTMFDMQSPSLSYYGVIASSNTLNAESSTTWTLLVPPLFELWVEAAAEARERTLSNAEAKHLRALATLLRRLTVKDGKPADLEQSIVSLVQKHLLPQFPLPVARSNPDIGAVNACLASILLIYEPHRASSVASYGVTMMQGAFKEGRVSEESAVNTRPFLALLLENEGALLADEAIRDAILAFTRAVPNKSKIKGLVIEIARVILAVHPGKS